MNKVELAKGMVTGAVSAYNHYCDVPANRELEDKLFTAIFEVISGEFPTFAQFIKYAEDYRKSYEGEPESED